MEKDNKFLLLNLNQKESKSLAQTLSNDTARRILDYLTEKQEASASELSKEINIPLPTVDYNLKQLVKANLVESKEFLWSKKGREINLYRLAKKLVIIAPKSTSLKEIKNLLPIGIISIATAFLIKFFNQAKNFTQTGAFDSAAESIKPMPGDVRSLELIDVVPILNQNWLWFLYGALFSILLILIFTWIRKLKK